MRIVVFTSNAIRHKYVANIFTKNTDKILVISECKASDAQRGSDPKSNPSPLSEHFYQRYQTEKKFFPGNNSFIGKTLPIAHKEVNSKYVYEAVKEFDPKLMFVFGASLISEPLLSLLPPGKFVNMHLGLSPYYRGSGTNFWPLVNGEPEYIGATILHIDPGVDTGDIIAHVLPTIEKGDDVHAIGCKVIKKSASCMVEIFNLVKNGRRLNRVKQWKVENEKYYKKNDFNEKALTRYKKNLASGLIEKYLKSPRKSLKTIGIHESEK